MMVIKDAVRPGLEDHELPAKEVFPIELSYTTLDYLGSFPNVTGDEVRQLVGAFHQAAENVADHPELQAKLHELLREINPRFAPKTYSQMSKANVLASVVAAIYGPIIHNFNSALLHNIQTGTLPPNIIAPPRDTIPFVHSLKTLAKARGIRVEVVTPFINRHTAGIQNNQVHRPPLESPYLKQHLAEHVAHLPKGLSFTEVEPGIYSTLSLKVSKMLKELGHINLAALKMYGLGPNLSYIHAVLSGGKEWVAEEAERKKLVDPQQIAGLMILLDSIEEFGMQDAFASIEELTVNNEGKIIPVIVHNDEAAQEIARATNMAVLDTAAMYSHHETELVLALLDKIPQMAAASKDLGLPITLGSIIPPDDRSVKEEHFKKIRASGLLHYPKGLSL